MPLLLASGDAALQKIFFIYLFFCIIYFFFREGNMSVWETHQ